MIVRRAALVLAVACLVASPGRAAPFAVDDATVTPGIGEQIVLHLAPALAQQGLGPELEDQLNRAIVPALGALRDQLNGTFGSFDLRAFLGAMATATAGAANVASFDHATEPSVLALGVTVGAALNAPSVAAVRGLSSVMTTGVVPAVGAGGSLGVSATFALAALGLTPWGPVDWDRFTVTASGFYVDLGTLAKGVAGGMLDNLTAPYTALGINVQYLALPGQAALGGGLLRWGGVRTGVGLHYSRLAPSVNVALPPGEAQNDFSWRGANAKLSAGWSGKARLGADIHALSVPLVASTQVQLLYLLTLYAGAAAELNVGRGTIEAVARAPVSLAVVTDQNESLEIAQPDARLDILQAARPVLGDVRGFAGLAVNLWVASVFAEASLDTSHSYAAAAGLRLFW